MKRVIFLLAMAMIFTACGSSNKNNDDEQVSEPQEQATANVSDAKVQVYYFHGKQRCPSCVAIQKVASETVAEAFSDNPEVEFVEVDFSVKANEALADKYEVAWSSLIIASGEKHTNLTEEGFANAMRNPEELKKLIIDHTNNYLIQ